jgi:hypothetical protein
MELSNGPTLDEVRERLEKLEKLMTALLKK